MRVLRIYANAKKLVLFLWRKRDEKKRYRSPLMASIQETAEGLNGAGLINKITMRKLDAMSLTPKRRISENKVAGSKPLVRRRAT